MNYSETTDSVSKFDKIAYFTSASFEDSKTLDELELYFNTKSKMKERYPNYYNEYIKSKIIADCIPIGNVFNLIISENNSVQSTYTAINIALQKLRSACLAENIKEIGISVKDIKLPTQSIVVDVDINREKVPLKVPALFSDAIKSIFYDTDTNIYLCY